MSLAGVRTISIGRTAVSDDIMVNHEGGTFLQRTADLASQLMGLGPLPAALDGLQNDLSAAVASLESKIEAAAEGNVVASTWAGLAAIAGTRVGQPGFVVGNDTGSHTDPVVGGAAANKGTYSWNASPAGWRRTGDLIDKAVVAASQAAASAAPGRPGVAPGAWFQSANLVAAGGPLTSLTDINPAWIVGGGDGEIVRLTNLAMAIAPRWPTKVAPGRMQEIAYAFSRVTDPANPATSVVRLGVRWYDANYAEIAASVEDVHDLTVASGRREITRTVGLDYIAPAAAVYYRPFVATVGTDHVTDIEKAEVREITNTFGLIERVINASSGRVAICGASLSGTYYSLPKKAWINTVASLTDWQFANFSITSDDALEAWSRLVNGAPIYGGLSLRDEVPEYTVIMLFGNDSNVRASRTRLFIENLRQLIKAIRSCGSKVILSMEGRKERGIEQAAMSALARDEGAIFWEITSEYFLDDATRNNDYHFSNHPGVRNTWHYVNVLMRRIAKLGRPAASFKVFRARRHRQLFSPAWSWTFDGGTLRCMPSATNNGTLVGSAALVADSLRGTVYQGSVAGDRMTFGGSPALPASYSFACWFNPTTLGGSRNIFAGFTAARLNVSLEGAELRVRHGSGTAQIIAATGVVTSVWRHLMVTYDAGSQILSAYLDGALLAQATGVPAHNCTDPQLGASVTGSSFIGKLDDVHIWNSALDPWQCALIAQHRDGLLYDAPASRHAVWQEIETGSYSLTGAQRPYYDALPSLTPAFVSQASEYATLQQGGALSFVDKALLQFVVPAGGSNTRGLRLRVKGAETGATIYWLSRRLTLPAGNAYNKSRGFVTLTNPVGLAVNDIYSYGGQDYTVNGVTRNKDGAGWVVWAFPEVSTVDVSGTLTRVSGTGPNSIAFTNTLNFADAPYYDRVDRPIARWIEGSTINADLRNGQASVNSTNLIRQVIDYDTVTVLVEKKGAFTLSDIELRWIGVPEKERGERAEALHRAGTELLAKTTFDGLSSSAWTAIGAAAETTPADGVLPLAVTKIVNVNKTDQVRQAVTINADPILRKSIQVRVGCRFAPAKFTPSAGAPTDLQEYREVAPITEDTPDVARLVIALDNGNSKYAVVARKIVGLAPTEVIIDVDIPNAQVWEASACRLTLSAEGLFGEDATIQLYSAHVIDCGPGVS